MAVVSTAILFALVCCKVAVVTSSQTWRIKLQGRPGEGYYIPISVGTPPQTLNVLIDTGSSNFAIASSQDPFLTNYFHANRSSSFVRKDMSVSVPYTMGSWEGYLGSDLVRLDSLPSLVRADVACITRTEHFFINSTDWQGILGLAFPAIMRPSSGAQMLLDVLISEGVMSNVFSLHLCGDGLGSLILGMDNASLESSEILYTPLRKAWYYEVVLTDLAVGNQSLNIDCKELNTDKTIVDSGTTNFQLHRPVFKVLLEAMKNHKGLSDLALEEFWNGQGVMCWHDAQYLWTVFPMLRLSLLHSDNSTFDLHITPKQYLRKVHDVDKDAENHTCCKFAIYAADSGTILGAVIMEGFKVVFDRQNKKVGFSTLSCAPNNTGEPMSEVKGPFPHPNPWICAFESRPSETLKLLTYAVFGIAAVCSLPLLLLIAHWMLVRWRKAACTCIWKRRRQSNSTQNLVDDE